MSPTASRSGRGDASPHELRVHSVIGSGLTARYSTEITDPLLHMTALEYNIDGQVVFIRDATPEHNYKHFEYDSDDPVEPRQSARGFIDRLCHLRALDDGDLSGPDGATPTTTRVYVLRARGPEPTTWSYMTYDDDGHVLTVRDPRLRPASSATTGDLVRSRIRR